MGGAGGTRPGENNPAMILIQPPNVVQGVKKFPVDATGINRRALSTVNRNISGAPPYPCPVNRRGLSEKEAVHAKNPPIPAHRPITRKLAAQLASKQQCKPQEIKRPILSDLIPSDSTDCTTVDEAGCDSSAPISVQHTDAMLEEIDSIEEVEMEDPPVGPVFDMDSGDQKDPLAVVDYVDDLYAFYEKSEIYACVPSNYMAQQTDINDRMRAILIDWLVEVHYKFELMEETLYLTVNLIDRFLSVKQITRKKLQLVGITAMFLACKYEEVSVPVLEDLILISDNAYDRQQVLDMEKLMAITLQFNLYLPTPYVFMRRFLKAAQSDKKLELLSFFIIELCLVEYEMLKYPPSMLAAAAIYTAQCTLSACKHWSKICELYSGYTEEQLIECSRCMVNYHKNSATGKLTGISRKYSSSKFGHASKVEPANFLLEAVQVPK